MTRAKELFKGKLGEVAKFLVFLIDDAEKKINSSALSQTSTSASPASPLNSSEQLLTSQVRTG